MPYTFSILLATYNRAGCLHDTLQSLRNLKCDHRWEVIVANNNSTDETQAVVDAVKPLFPVPLRSVFVTAQGKAAALNAAMQIATGEIFVFTDDDARFPDDWLSRIGTAFEALKCDYVGGRVMPLWSAPPPKWFPTSPGQMWAVIAVMDHGDTVREFDEGVGWPLGVNMAVQRSAFQIVGGWDTMLDRHGKRLIGQGQREWCLRARAAGLHGFYVPAIVVEHLVTAERLSRHYFRRWFYWLGVSRALLYDRLHIDLERPEDTKDFSSGRHLCGVPLYLYRRCLERAGAAIAALSRRDYELLAKHEMWLCFFAGVLGQRFRSTLCPLRRG